MRRDPRRFAAAALRCRARKEGRLLVPGAAEATSRETGPAARWGARLPPGLGRLHSPAACGLPAAASWIVTSPRQRSPDGKCSGRLPPSPPPSVRPGLRAPTTLRRPQQPPEGRPLPKHPRAGESHFRTISGSPARPPRGGLQTTEEPRGEAGRARRSWRRVVTPLPLPDGRCPEHDRSLDGLLASLPKCPSRCLWRGRRPCLPAPRPPSLPLRSPGSRQGGAVQRGRAARAQSCLQARILSGARGALLGASCERRVARNLQGPRRSGKDSSVPHLRWLAFVCPFATPPPTRRGRVEGLFTVLRPPPPSPGRSGEVF